MPECGSGVFVAADSLFCSGARLKAECEQVVTGDHCGAGSTRRIGVHIFPIGGQERSRAYATDGAQLQSKVLRHM